MDMPVSLQCGNVKKKEKKKKKRKKGEIIIDYPPRGSWFR
jgi:hypothetical protein